MLDAAVDGLAQVLTVESLFLLVLGGSIGIVVGLLPGLGGAVTLALMLPFTFDMEPVQVFSFLLGMLAATGTAGDITSVLFGIPGETTSAAVVLDGHPMARRGEVARALGLVIFSSLFGAWLGAFAMAMAVPILRPLAMALGSPEFLMITLLGLAFVVTLSRGNVAKGMVMACLGLLVSMIGIDPQTAIPRFTFGQLELWDGIDIIPLVIGLFGGAEVLLIMLTKLSVSNPTASRSRSPYRDLWHSVGETLRHWRVVCASTLTGVGVGLIPGIGGAVSQFLAYGQAQQMSKTPEQFGKGSPEGVVATGAVSNAKDAGNMIPVLAFGIPGSVTTAILLNAFLITGLQPGLEMLTVNLDVTFSIVWVLILGNLFAVVATLVLIKPIIKVTTISGPMLVPFLLVALTIGAFASRNSTFDVYVMIAATVVGVGAVRWDWPRVPFLMGVVLGAVVERYLFLSHSLYGWSWVDRPGVLVISAIIVLAMVRVAFQHRQRARRRVAADGDAVPVDDGRRG